MYKTMMRLATLDGNATVTALRSNLRELQGVPYATFHDYMSRLQDDWMDQTGDMKEATHEDIMKKAKAKFDLANLLAQLALQAAEAAEE